MKLSKHTCTLGIHVDTHDSGAALVENGKIVAAINEERLSRIKLDGSIPWKSIEEVLRISNKNYSDIDIIAFTGFKPGLKKMLYFFWHQMGRIVYTRGKSLKSFLTTGIIKDRGRFLKQTGISGLIRSRYVNNGIRKIIKYFYKKNFTGQIKFVNHDLCHAASAYYTSGHNEAFVAIIEGSSFSNSWSFWSGSGGQLNKIHEIPTLHSAGNFYELITLLLGFDPKCHAGKITGLAGFGNPDTCYEIIKPLLVVKNISVVSSPKLYTYADEYHKNGKRIPKDLEKFSKEDLAAAFQKRLEEVIIEVLNNFTKNETIKHLVLAGGVTANVKLNMEITNSLNIEDIYIHPGMSDVGQALGAALSTYSKYNSNLKPFKLDNVYFGPEFTEEEIEKELNKNNLEFTKEEDISKSVANLLAQNKVIAFFQGRMEYGPRALGNRSILYPATDPKVNNWLNKRLGRTEFMPFAPVTLLERASDCYLEEDLKKSYYTSQFMTIAMHVTDYMKNNMPAAVHVDGTARPQLISEENNKVYYQVLKEYENKTGLPSLINTSFNMHGEPIVCSPKEAIKAFLLSNLDALAIGNYLVKKA